MAKRKGIKWLSAPEKHDYSAAVSYLTLILGPGLAIHYAEALERAEMSTFASKDIFRASQLSLLGVSNSHVERDRERISRQEKLSPLLLCVSEGSGSLIIADGYHRLCAVYALDEDAMIPCKIVGPESI